MSWSYRASELCAGLILTTAVITAHAPAVLADTALTTKFDLDIPAQPLNNALEAFGRATNQQLAFDKALVLGKTSPALRGSFTAEQALGRLLEGSGLTAKKTPGGVLVIERVLSANPAAEPAATSVAPATSMDEIVVTAQKKAENLQDVPVPVSVINAELLADNGQALLRDYYTSVPGLNITPNVLSAQIISIRGVSTGDYSNPTVGVLVDDAVYTSALNISFAVPDIDPGDLARVEVLRGPQGTLYGANSMGGLIKYITTDPSTSGYSGRLEAGTSSVHNGSEPGYQLRAAFNIPLSDMLAFRVSGFERQDPGYIDNPILGIDGINEAQAYGGRLSVLWKPSDAFSIKLSALDQNTKGNGLSDVDKAPGLADLQQNYVPGVGPYDQRLQAYSATLKAHLPGVDLTSVTAYNVSSARDTWDGSGFYSSYTQSNYNVGGALWYDWFTNNKFAQEIRASGALWKNFEWLGGVFYTHEHSTHIVTVNAEDAVTGRFAGPVATYEDLPISYNEYAAFAALTYHFTDQFDIQIGGRESHINVDNETEVQAGPIFGATALITPEVSSSANAFTYLLTPRFKFTPDIMAYARLASGYRPGGPNLAYAVSLGAPAAFNPDKTYNYEIGLKGDFLDRLLSVDASLYDIEWKKIQLQVSEGAGGQTVGFNINGSNARSKGAELSVTLRSLPGLSMTAWAAYDDAVLTQSFPVGSVLQGAAGDRLPIASRYSGNLSIQDEFPLGTNLTGYVSGQAAYVGDREGMFVSSGERLKYPGYTKMDLRTGVRFDSWNINVYVNNVTDQRGVINTVDFFPNAYIYIQPRTVGLMAAKKF